MNWEQKFAALKALVGFGDAAALYMRQPGNWYVGLRGVEIGNGRTLKGLGGDGNTPEAAVEDAWNAATDGLAYDEVLILGAMRAERRCVKWNGFMWGDAEDPAPKVAAS